MLKIYTSLTFSLAIILSSCDLVKDLDDYSPKYSVDAEFAIHDQTSAEQALTGVYAGWAQSSKLTGMPDIMIIPSLLGITASQGEAGESRFLALNKPNKEMKSIEGGYLSLYSIINRANWVIEKVSLLSGDKFSNPKRKREILGEAKTMRALAHFYLLRLWGQYYDTSSKYGIVITLEPTRTKDAKARSTVEETYQAILNDLNDAIIEAPILRKKIFANQTFAKSLKAKVLLYKGSFSEASQTAKEVIDHASENFGLLNDFQSLFDLTTPDVFDNKEALFCAYGDKIHGLGLSAYWLGSFCSISNRYQELAKNGGAIINDQVIKYDSTRISFISPNSEINTNNKYQRAPYEIAYHMRMAEIYLIFAEANARTHKKTYQDALWALNLIRKRAGAHSVRSDGFNTYPSDISNKKLLEAIRIEKMMELGTENGESWFDLVRYAYIDGGFESGFKVYDEKSAAINPDKYILPIPEESVKSGNQTVIQNPSY
ncbi:membrane protein (plasmid) [Fulvitalea axinellae]|uniref:Membrane protein n=1 Tax=Fulvitalea axinellae TaxID=1182444 RepID=A0AAU9CVL6_9BACT|nr:membrane protein [Fulvitalea axinellae]